MVKAGAARLLTEARTDAAKAWRAKSLALIGDPGSARRTRRASARADWPARNAASDIVNLIEGDRAPMTAAFHNFKRIHLVGIGGIGMSGIAEVLLTLGYAVSGSDARPSPSPSAWKLSAHKSYEGHSAENVHGAHVVVTSSAIPRDNPELAGSRRAAKSPSSRAPKCSPS